MLVYIHCLVLVLMTHGNHASTINDGQASGSLATKASAFTAIKTDVQTGAVGDVVTFQEVPTNHGNDFNQDSNKFICHIPGTYFFTFSVAVNKKARPVIWLVKNGNIFVGGHSDDQEGGFQMFSNTAVVDLTTEDQVWLQFAPVEAKDDPVQTIKSGYNKVTTFSGFLLYENN